MGGRGWWYEGRVRRFEGHLWLMCMLIHCERGRKKGNGVSIGTVNITSDEEKRQSVQT